MMRFRLRTLMILLAILPPIVAWLGPPICRWLFPPPTSAASGYLGRVQLIDLYPADSQVISGQVLIRLDDPPTIQPQ